MSADSAKLNAVKAAVRDVVIGKDDVVELLQIALLSRGHVLLEDVPGTGKTQLAKAFSASIEGNYNRIQCTPDLMPADVMGFHYYNQHTQLFELREGPVMTNILLTDEINRAAPRSQSSLLEVMEEQQVTIDGKTLSVPDPFMMVATQNPLESQQGNFPLPEAQIDRFMLTVKMGYPDEANEWKMMQRYMHDSTKNMTSAVTLNEVIAMQNETEQIMISEDVQGYLLKIVHMTRTSAETEIGASPRGTLAFMRAAQAKAYLAGRTYVVPEDVKNLAVPVLAHRLVLTIEGEMRKTKEEVLKECLLQVAAPVERGEKKSET